MHNPLQQHQSYYPSHHDDVGNAYYDQNEHTQWDEAESLRGGSTMTIPEPEEQPFHPPKILLKHMSMALRVTCEWNRRLLAGVNRTFRFFGNRKRIRHGDSNPESQQHDQPTQELQVQPTGDFFGQQPVNIHPDRTWNPPIREGGPDLELESLTVFHALEPQKLEAAPVSDSEGETETESGTGGISDAAISADAPRGVAHWGPELLPYLEQVTDLLEIDSNGLEIALAMIYLDRACSVDTIRTNGCPPCPFCVPRTVHRLSLVALILAKQAVNGNSGKTVPEYLQELIPLGIPLDQLEMMASWMLNALGDSGSFVTVGQMRVWSENWEAMFYPKRHQAIQQQRKEEQRRLLQQQAEQQKLMMEQQQEAQQQYHQGYQQPQPQQQNYY